MSIIPATQLDGAVSHVMADPDACVSEILRSRLHSCQRCGTPFVYRYLILPHDLRIIDFLCQQCMTEVVDQNPGTCAKIFHLPA
jgi:hypothetical protein